MASSWKLFDDKLINIVRVKPVLYNNRLKEYGNNTHSKRQCLGRSCCSCARDQ